MYTKRNEISPSAPSLLVPRLTQKKSASFQGGAQPRTPRVKTVILCGAFGATLGDELRARGDDERNRTFLVSGADGVSRATRPLLALGPDVNAACPLDLSLIHI